MHKNNIIPSAFNWQGIKNFVSRSWKYIIGTFQDICFIMQFKDIKVKRCKLFGLWLVAQVINQVNKHFMNQITKTDFVIPWPYERNLSSKQPLNCYIADQNILPQWSGRSMHTYAHIISLKFWQLQFLKYYGMF